MLVFYQMICAYAITLCGSQFHILNYLLSLTNNATTNNTENQKHCANTRMLNEMEEDLDTATTNLSMVTIKTKELIQKSGGKRNFIIIVILSLVVVVLLFLILYS